jgi:hypothetical protein
MVRDTFCCQRSYSWHASIVTNGAKSVNNRACPRFLPAGLIGAGLALTAASAATLVQVACMVETDCYRSIPDTGVGCRVSGYGCRGAEMRFILPVLIGAFRDASPYCLLPGAGIYVHLTRRKASRARCLASTSWG